MIFDLFTSDPEQCEEGFRFYVGAKSAIRRNAPEHTVAGSISTPRNGGSAGFQVQIFARRSARPCSMF
jgi:hypothetical protein